MHLPRMYATVVVKYN